MNLRYLEVLEAVEQTGTFTGAAKKLHLTQSAVSHAIADLEQQAGTALFDRLPRGVRLTHCGETLLEESRGILNACRSLDRRMSHLEEYTPIHVVSSITIASFWLPQMIKRLYKQMPNLSINVCVVSAANALEILKRGEADMALLEGAEPQGAFRTVLLGAYKLRAACSPDFSLSKQTLSPHELCSLPLLLRERGSAIRDVFDSMMSLKNETAYPVWESVNSGALIKAAEAGLGITVLPELLLEESVHQKKLRFVSIDGIEMENKMLAVLHKDKYMTQSLQEVLYSITGMTVESVQKS